jgi:hypothetical protein
MDRPLNEDGQKRIARRRDDSQRRVALSLQLYLALCCTPAIDGLRDIPYRLDAIGPVSSTWDSNLAGGIGPQPGALRTNEPPENREPKGLVDESVGLEALILRLSFSS